MHHSNSIKACTFSCAYPADGKPLPHYSKGKSESALSRFLNTHTWSTRQIIYHVREQALEQINSHRPLGRKAFLQVIIDLTTLEKCGRFKGLDNLISVYNGKRGLHIVVLYLVIGKWRIPDEKLRHYGQPTPEDIYRHL